MASYSELLKDPRWQKKRLMIFERDRWQCQCCMESETTLHVHHNRYVGKFPWDCPDEYLITLCEACHRNEEDAKKLDLFTLVDGLGITRYQMALLMESIRFRMTKSEQDPFWAFHDEVLRAVVTNDELGELIEFRQLEKNNEELING